MQSAVMNFLGDVAHFRTRVYRVGPGGWVYLLSQTGGGYGEGWGTAPGYSGLKSLFINAFLRAPRAGRRLLRGRRGPIRPSAWTGGYRLRTRALERFLDKGRGCRRGLRAEPWPGAQRGGRGGGRCPGRFARGS